MGQLQYTRLTVMSKFQQFWWYVGVGTVFVGLILSVVQGNWFLAILCAVVTAGLRKIQPQIEIPKVYAKRGISTDMFTPGGKRK